jgi:hypothetical protein
MRKALFTLIFICISLLCTYSHSIDSASVVAAARIMGIPFTKSETDSMMPLLLDQFKNYESMRKVSLPNSVPTAYNFNPVPVGKTFKQIKKSFKASDYSRTVRPADMNDLAFYSIGQLAELIPYQEGHIPGTYKVLYQPPEKVCSSATLCYHLRRFSRPVTGQESRY